MNDVYFVSRLYWRPSFDDVRLVRVAVVEVRELADLRRAPTGTTAPSCFASGVAVAASIVLTNRPRPDTPVSVDLPLGVPLYLPNTTTGRFANTSGSDLRLDVVGVEAVERDLDLRQHRRLDVLAELRRRASSPSLGRG